MRATLTTTVIFLTAIAFISLFGVSFAYLLQIYQGYSPCPLCIVQRYCYILLFMSAITALLFEQSPTRRILCFFCLVLSLISTCVALYHLYIRFIHTATSCAADPIELFLNQLYPAQLLPSLFESIGNCLDIHPPLLMIDITIWAGLGAIAMLILSIATISKR